MNESIHKYMKVGLVHFMAYPSAMTGEGDIETSVYRVLSDDYFSAIELTRITDRTQRARITELVRQSGVTLGYGAQPQLLRNGENVNSLDETLRERAVERVKRCVDEAYEMGAKGFAFLSGRYDPDKVEEAYAALLRSTGEICAYAGKNGDLAVNLEVFDYDVEKYALIGPAPLARRLADEICAEHKNFGLMADLSHITQLRETLDENLDPIAPYIRHAHIANSVLTKGAPAYGDQHPRFGFPNSEVDVTKLAAFLRKLFGIGYLGIDRQPVVAFEVKPWEGENSEMLIAGAKRFLNAAWQIV